MSGQKIRVRFAPSPTGFLHVGGLRTALFNFLFARHEGGKFILRIEDTDKSREVAGAEENIIQTLRDFKLDFDEGPIRQSERLEIYKKYADELIAKGAAYRCYCSPERIEQLKQEAAAAKLPFKYDKRCLRERPSTGSGANFVVRQNVPEEGSVEFEDLVHGKIKVENRTLDDGILLKSDGYPVYNFANVIDDHEMGITHVIRGEEFIPSTPKHILLYQAFGWNVPQFAHLPLILDRERKKLSKRSGDVAVKEYVEKGYLREALLNFVALLGWNPKTTQEIFSLDELIKEFSLEKVNRAGAIFDIEKLDFINRQWQKRLNLGIADPMYKRAEKLVNERFDLSRSDLSRTTLPRLGEGLGERSKILELIWPLILERVKGPSELEAKFPEFHFFFEEPEYEAKLLIWKDVSKIRTMENLGKMKTFLRKNLGIVPGRREQGIEQKLKSFLKQQGIATGEALWPLRAALSGLRNSPGPFDILDVFSQIPRGKEIITRRLQTAIDKLSKI